MKRLEPTRALAMQIWWAFAWRALLGFILAGLAVGVPLAWLTTRDAIDARFVDRASFAGTLLGAAVSFEVLYRLLRKRFQGFEIALVAAETE